MAENYGLCCNLEGKMTHMPPDQPFADLLAQRRVAVTGIGTNVGKTVLCAVLLAGWKAAYWKPIQTGSLEGTDADRLSRMLAPQQRLQVLPSAYVLPEPLSPDAAAARAGLTLELDALALPAHEGPLVVEGAGGLLVPINDRALMADLFARLHLPLILVVRPYLGAINHTLLSLEALAHRNLPLAGIVYSGPPSPEFDAAVRHFGKTPVLGSLPRLNRFDFPQLLKAYQELNLPC